MIDKATRMLLESLGRMGRLNASVAERCARLHASGLADSARLVSLNGYLVERWVNGGLSPLIKSLWAMEQDIADPLLDCLVGRRKLGDCVQEIGERAHSGTRYRGLVRRMGGQLFGSARFDGEQVLASNDVFQLSHLPPPEGLQPARTALFHVGGFIPYGDRVFRFLPEANLFLPFLRRGLPVYAMEVKPTVSRRRLQRFTLQELIDTIGEMTGTASRHHGAQKMLIEGYCGLGLPMLTYLAARPEEADSRFSAAMLMAAPVDARACTLIGEMLESVPRQLLSTRLTLSGVFGRLLGGEPLRMAIDIPVNTLFYKTRTGQFLTGWKRRGYSAVERIEDLSPEQRLELAGAYWISPTTFSRHPIPPDFLRTFSRLWQEGLGDDLVLPLRYHGAPVSLRAIEQRTRIRIAGFYGGEDRLIPASTADVLMRAMPRRYTHTVHAGAGHVSYIVVPAMWDSSLPIAFKPGPIDLALELARGVSAAPASARGRPGPAGSPA